MFKTLTDTASLLGECPVWCERTEGLSQSQLAHRHGMSRSTISRGENNTISEVRGGRREDDCCMDGRAGKKYRSAMIFPGDAYLRAISEK
ncbi:MULTISPECIES: helix-turn-helix transcriptional regulator [unclassified Pseudomonas]|uniref:helix-turn-helix transcriptional regulator n=1 Tax=unclassified Pseudomonas TaxID=196821 RepID=UPI0030D6EBB7